MSLRRTRMGHTSNSCLARPRRSLIGRRTPTIAMICCPDLGLAPTIINADGSRLTQLPIPPGFPAGACNVWSADGLRLACGFGGFDPPQPDRDGMYTLRASDGGAVQVTTTSGEDGAFDYSPEGGRIVFFRIDYSRPERNRTALFVVNVDGGGLGRITSWDLVDSRRVGPRMADGSCSMPMGGSGSFILTAADSANSRSIRVVEITSRSNLSGRPMGR